MTLSNTTSAQDRLIEKYENFGGFEDILAIIEDLDKQLSEANKAVEDR